MHKFELTAITPQVTYAGDDPIPGTEYGEEVEIVVTADTTIDAADVEKTITIRIGDKTFLPEALDEWAVMIQRAKDFANTLK